MRRPPNAVELGEPLLSETPRDRVGVQIGDRLDRDVDRIDARTRRGRHTGSSRLPIARGSGSTWTSRWPARCEPCRARRKVRDLPDTPVVPRAEREERDGHPRNPGHLGTLLRIAAAHAQGRRTSEERYGPAGARDAGTSGVCGTLSVVRWALVGTLGLSLVAHGAVAAYFFVPRAAPAAPAQDRDPPPQNCRRYVRAARRRRRRTRRSPTRRRRPTRTRRRLRSNSPMRPRDRRRPRRRSWRARPSHQGRPSAGHAAPGQADSAPGVHGLGGAVRRRRRSLGGRSRARLHARLPAGCERRPRLAVRAARRGR